MRAMSPLVRTQSVLWLALCATALVLAPAVSGAGEADPWAADNDEAREHMEELADEEITGQLDDEQARCLSHWGGISGGVA